MSGRRVIGGARFALAAGVFGVFAGGCAGGVSETRPVMGCGNRIVDEGEACDDGNEVADDGCTPACELGPVATRRAIEFTWHVLELGSSVVGCPAGSPMIAAYVQPVDDLDQPSGEAMIADVFACDDGAGRTSPLPLARYATWLANTDADATSTSSRSPAKIVDLRYEAPSLDVRLYTDAGYLRVRWALQRGGQPATCADAWAQGVRGIAIDLGPARGGNSACEAGGVLFGPMLLGAYDVEVTLRGGQWGVIGAPVTRPAQLVATPAEFAEADVVLQLP